jgi:hypothetical protein
MQLGGALVVLGGSAMLIGGAHPACIGRTRSPPEFCERRLTPQTTSHVRDNAFIRCRGDVSPPSNAVAPLMSGRAVGKIEDRDEACSSPCPVMAAWEGGGGPQACR